MNFEDWVNNLRNVIQLKNSSLDYSNGRWELSKREAFWREHGGRIFDQHLDTFRECAIEVLSEIDPQFELGTDERYTANIHDMVLRHSDSLREGIAETLAMLANRGNYLVNCTRYKAGDTARVVVRELLGKASWQLWGSLDSLLPYLAEAAPDEFMSALEVALESNDPPFRELYSQEGAGIFGRTYMSGILWSLEALAWDDERLFRVVSALAGLALIDPGGNWSNRPINSLTDVLLPWHPQTFAPVARRLAAVRSIREEAPDVTWKLLISLLPDQRRSTSGTYKPRYCQEIADDWSPTVTHAEYWEEVSGHADAAVSMACQDPSRLIELVGMLESLPKLAFEGVMRHLSSEEVARLDEQVRMPIWNALLQFTQKHRKFQDANGSLPIEVLDSIIETAENIKPESSIGRNMRLFTDRDYEIYEERGDYQEQARVLEEARSQAAKEVFEEVGYDGLLDFAELVDSPYKLGASIALSSNYEADSFFIPCYLLPKSDSIERLMSGYVWARVRDLGFQWVDSIYSDEWPNELVTKFLTLLPFDSGTWERVDVWLGDHADTYWSSVMGNPYQAEGDLLPAVDRLLAVGRGKFAVECLYVRIHRGLPLNIERSVAALLSAVSDDKEALHVMPEHHASELIKLLQESSEVPDDEMIRVEWAYLNLLQRDRELRPAHLELALGQNPDFFCEVIRMIYRSTNEDAEEVDDGRPELASHAWKLLHEWQLPPGVSEEGQVSPEALEGWMRRVEESVKESGHLEVAMLKVGEVFYYAPEDPDGLWIHAAFATELNRRDIEEIRRGFGSEIYNSRGAHWVDPTGEPERNLAEHWRDRALSVEQRGFARFATELRRVAQSYDREAQRVVDEAGSRA